MSRLAWFSLLVTVLLTAGGCSATWVGTLASSLLPSARPPSAPALEGRRFYAGPSGNDTEDCAQNRPCREIRRALSLVRAGDTIFVADGSYKGFTVRSLHGQPTRPITIKALGRGGVVTSTTDRPDPENRDNILITFSSNIVIDGLRSVNAPRAGLRIDQSPRVTVRNSVFGNNRTWGLFTDFSDDLLIEANEAYGSMNEHGIYISNSGDRPMVRGNIVHDNAASGIQLNGDLSQGGDGIISGALIEGNVVYGNGRRGGAALNLDGVQHSVVRNNILYANHASGIAMYRIDGARGPMGMQIYHNTIDMATDGRYAIRIFQAAGRITLRNNILYNRNSGRGALSFDSQADVKNIDSDYNIMGGGIFITPDDGTTRHTLAEWQARGYERHSVTAALRMLFVAPVAADYHLAPTSPAIDRGQPLRTVTVDFEGQPRPRGAAPDIGADER